MDGSLFTHGSLSEAGHTLIHKFRHCGLASLRLPAQPPVHNYIKDIPYHRNKNGAGDGNTRILGMLQFMTILQFYVCLSVHAVKYRMPSAIPYGRTGTYRTNLPTYLGHN